MSEFERELQEDALSRERALAISSFIVEAPAGAGKTELLTQRFLKLLQQVDEPEEVIAITFTNKAAAEMRLRILDSLQNAANAEFPSQTHKQKTYALSLAVLEKSQKQAWCLLENPARLRIFTIDGLCAYLARQMPLMSRFGSEPTIADDPSIYYAQAAEKTLSMMDDVDNNAVILSALRYLDNDTNQLKKILIQMLAKRDQWLHYAQQTISVETLENTLKFVLETELAAIAKIINAPVQHNLMPFARYAAANLACENPIALLNDWHDYLQATPTSLMLWQAIADLLLTKESELRKTVDVRLGFPADGKQQKQEFLALLAQLRDDPAIEAALKRVRLLPKLNDHQTSWHIIATLSQLLNIAAAQLWLVFSQAREVDFVEVAQRAISALALEYGEPTELALKLDYQIKHILVDEFQDTSPSQIALFEQLTAGWQSADGRTLFLVGDPMQSIYRFRKANVGLFLNAAHYGIGDISLEKLRLYRNNRSCPALVNWINTTFKSIFPQHDNVEKGAISYRQFIATKTADLAAGVAIHPLIKQPDESAETVKSREALAVVAIIQREQAQNPKAKIAILVRAKSHLQSIVSELRRNHKDIRFQAVEIEALSNRQIVQDLLALTRALHHRADRVSWLATLRAPWCGLTLHDLHALAGKDHDNTIWALMQNADLALSADGKYRLAHVRAIFAEAFANQGRVNISRWVRAVWLMLGGASCLWEASDVVDVQAFFDCIEALERNNQFDLERLANEISKLFAAPDSQGENLQMMTIHKSKGLEFDCVILPGLGSSIGGNDDQPMVLWEEISLKNQQDKYQQTTALLAAPMVPKGLKQNEVSPYDYLQALEKERDQNEAARILYVAATRAERKLHLVGIASANKKDEVNPTKNTYLDLLWVHVANDYLAKQLASNNTDFTTETQTMAPATLAQFVPKLVRLKNPALPNILQADVKLLYSPQNLAETEAESESAIASKIGTLTHQYLEIISKQGLENWNEQRISSLFIPMERWFIQQGFIAEIAKTSAKQVQLLLNNTLNSKDGQWVLKVHEHATAELALTQVQNGEAKTLIIDRTFIENSEGVKTRWVIDYKTVALAPSTSSAEFKTIAEQYRAQLEQYAALFKEQGLPIKKAVFFVSVGQLQLI